MGAQARPHGALQGFGYTKQWGRTGKVQTGLLGRDMKGSGSGPTGVSLAIPQLYLTWTDAFLPGVLPCVVSSAQLEGRCDRSGQLCLMDREEEADSSPAA